MPPEPHNHPFLGRQHHPSYIPIPCLQAQRRSQPCSLPASQKLLNGILSGPACRPLLEVLVPIKICIPVGIIGNLTQASLLMEIL